MSNFRQMGLGFLAALFSTALVFGSMLLALVEGGKRVALAPIYTPTNTLEIATPMPGEPTFTPTPSPTQTQTPLPSCTDTPSDWTEYLVMPGESLASIAQQYNIPEGILRALNCLQSDGIMGGIVLWVPPKPLPPTPTATFTPTEPATDEDESEQSKPSTKSQACTGHPSGWVTYRIRSGDNLFRIALSYGLSTQALMNANCLTSRNIRPGQVIYVPRSLVNTTRPPATRIPPTRRPTNEVPPPDSNDPPSPVTVEPPAPVVTEPPIRTEPPSPPPSEPPSPEPSEPPPYP